MTFTYAHAIILMSALGAVLGHANPIIHFPILVMLLPVGLCLLAWDAKRGRQAFWRGYWTGVLTYWGCLYWTALPVHDFGSFSWFLAVPCPILVGLWGGVYLAVFCWCAHHARKRLSWPLAAVFLGASWAVLEAVVGMPLFEFPWLLISAAFAPWPFAIQAADLVGAHGLSMILATAAVMMTYPLSGKQARFQALATAMVIFLALSGYGTWKLQVPLNDPLTASVSLVQGNFDQSEKWDPQVQNATVERYTQATLEDAAMYGPDLVVWPETAMPFFFQEENDLSNRVRATAKESGTPLLFGSPGVEFGPDSEPLLYNRAYLLDDQGQEIGRYAKQHLVPFGEYQPLRGLLPIIDKLVEGLGDFQSGTNSGPVTSGNLALGVLICYESIFTDLAQARVKNGANLLVNMSNDAWFGYSSAPWQLLQLSVLRAVEQDRYLVRATNTGISAFIDPRGRILDESGLFVAQTMHQTVGLRSGKTVFHRIQPLMLPSIAGLAIILGLWTLFKGRRNNRRRDNKQP